MSKGHVAPIKTLTLPKLELMAAVTATRMAKFVSFSQPAPYSSTHMDRQSNCTALNQKWKPFQILCTVYQRVTEIL